MILFFNFKIHILSILYGLLETVPCFGRKDVLLDGDVHTYPRPDFLFSCILLEPE